MIYSKGQIKSKAIIVLANNLQFFQLFINNIPNTLNDFILIAVNQTRIGDKTKQLNQILNKSIINSYPNKKKNFYILSNINEINKSNKNIIKDLSDIINEKNIKK